MQDMTFAERLKQARYDHDRYGDFEAGDESGALTLAEAVGATVEDIHNWESGASEPNLSQLMKLCDIFKYTAEWFITGEERHSVYAYDLTERQVKALSEMAGLFLEANLKSGECGD